MKKWSSSSEYSYKDLERNEDCIKIFCEDLCEISFFGRSSKRSFEDYREKINHEELTKRHSWDLIIIEIFQRVRPHEDLLVSFLEDFALGGIFEGKLENMWKCYMWIIFRSGSLNFQLFRPLIYWNRAWSFVNQR